MKLNMRTLLRLALGSQMVVAAIASPVNELHNVVELPAKKGVALYAREGADKGAETGVGFPLPELDKRIRMRRIEVDSHQSAMIAAVPSIVLTGAGFTVACLVAGGGPICIVPVAVALIATFLGAFLFKSTITEHASPAKAQSPMLLDPGTEFALRAGRGYFELDTFLRPHFTNQSWANPELQDHLESLRDFPPHTAVYKGHAGGGASISIAMDHDQQQTLDHTNEKRAKTHKFEKLTYSWDENKRKPYSKLSKRHSDAQTLGKGLANFMSENPYSAYCLSFKDKTHPEVDANRGTLHVNKGSGVFKTCQKV